MHLLFCHTIQYIFYPKARKPFLGSTFKHMYVMKFFNFDIFHTYTFWQILTFAEIYFRERPGQKLGFAYIYFREEDVFWYFLFIFVLLIGLFYMIFRDFMGIRLRKWLRNSRNRENLYPRKFVPFNRICMT